MKKYKKLLATVCFASLPFIQSAQSMNYNFNLNGIAFQIHNIRLDNETGIKFDNFKINNNSFAFHEVSQFINQLEELDENDEIEFDDGSKILVADILDFWDSDELQNIINQIEAQLVGVSENDKAKIVRGFTQYISDNQINPEVFLEYAQKSLIPMTYSIVQDLSDMIDLRLDGVDGFSKLASNNGIAAGDVSSEFVHGIWVKGALSKNKYAKLNGFRPSGNATKMALGYDIKINDNITSGIALGYQQNNLSIRNNNQKLNAKLKSILGMLYARYNFESPTFINAQYSYSTSVFSSKNKNALGVLLLGQNRYHNLNATLGYDYAISQNTEITPSLGIKYLHHDWKKLPNKFSVGRTISAKNGNASYLTLGVRIKSLIDNDSYRLVPYFYLGFDSMINQSKTKLTVKNNDLGTSQKFAVNVAEKNIFNAETGVTTKLNDVLGTSISYKYTKSKSFQSHSGTLGLKLSF